VRRQLLVAVVSDLLVNGLLERGGDGHGSFSNAGDGGAGRNDHLGVVILKGRLLVSHPPGLRGGVAELRRRGG
jgi:hypothetical protein